MYGIRVCLFHSIFDPSQALHGVPDPFPPRRTRPPSKPRASMAVAKWSKPRPGHHGLRPIKGWFEHVHLRKTIIKCFGTWAHWVAICSCFRVAGAKWLQSCDHLVEPPMSEVGDLLLQPGRVGIQGRPVSMCRSFFVEPVTGHRRLSCWSNDSLCDSQDASTARNYLKAQKRRQAKQERSGFLVAKLGCSKLWHQTIPN